MKITLLKSAGLVGFSVLSVSLYLFLFSSIVNFNSDTEIKIGEAEVLQRKISIAHSIRKTIPDWKEANVEKYFIKIGDVIHAVNVLEKSAKLVDLTISVDSIEEIEPATGEKALNVSVSLRGEYNKIISYLNILENLPFASVVNKMELSAGDYDWRGGFLVSFYVTQS